MDIKWGANYENIGGSCSLIHISDCMIAKDLFFLRLLALDLVYNAILIKILYFYYFTIKNRRMWFLGIILQNSVKAEF